MKNRSPDRSQLNYDEYIGMTEKKQNLNESNSDDDNEEPKI